MTVPRPPLNTSNMRSRYYNTPLILASLQLRMIFCFYDLFEIYTTELGEGNINTQNEDGGGGAQIINIICTPERGVPAHFDKHTEVVEILECKKDVDILSNL